MNNQSREICTSNQWFAPLARITLRERAIAERAIQNSRGYPQSIELYIANIEMTWLDVAIPAGNA